MLAAIALASLLQASSTYRTALQQADAMFDEHLQEVARSVRGGMPLAPGRDGESYDFLVQIWGPDGTQIFSSTGPVLPAQALLGFSDIAVGGVRYRVYSLQTPAAHRADRAGPGRAPGAGARAGLARRAAGGPAGAAVDDGRGLADQPLAGAGGAHAPAGGAARRR